MGNARSMAAAMIRRIRRMSAEVVNLLGISRCQACASGWMVP
jgi:hypothetical protein